MAIRRGGSYNRAMLVTFIDDSVPFDGHSPTNHPLGGAEKSVVGLANVFAQRGHTVRVYNRCDFPVVADGVSWQPIDECQASQTDWLIVHRNPSLFRMIPDASRRAILLSAPADTLGKAESIGPLKQYKPAMILQGLAHSLLIPPALQSFSAATVLLGVAECYRKAAPMAPVNPPRAVVTTHPLRGLEWLLDVWRQRVHTKLPWAELHVYSAVLEKGSLGAKVSESIKPILDQALAAESCGVRLKRPLADPEMVDVYRQARVHLYPSSSRDVLCNTLAESQAVGLPGVARPIGAADERLRNGETGYLAPDEESFANLAIRLLDDVDMFNRLSEQARAQQRNTSWDRAAEEIERVLI